MEFNVVMVVNHDGFSDNFNGRFFGHSLKKEAPCGASGFTHSIGAADARRGAIVFLVVLIPVKLGTVAACDVPILPERSGAAS